MAHHKRKRPKNRRAGCLYCKPHKMNGAGEGMKLKASVKRKLQKEETPAEIRVRLDNQRAKIIQDMDDAVDRKIFQLLDSGD